MSAIKAYYHDLIESQSRQYNILELQKLDKDKLIEIASGMNITVGDAQGKQTLIYKILEKQSLTTPIAGRKSSCSKSFPSLQGGECDGQLAEGVVLTSINNPESSL